VNCLIAFTNNPHSMEVALNATAFLRYCATKLAEGAIGELPDVLPGGVVEAERLAPTRVVSGQRDVLFRILCTPHPVVVH
jgi:brefeldin A-inhibited guanine nucleotide-exchange protein